ncbi:related to Putative esterase C31F10.02 [Ustilago trichophora]|uniref:Related to Putative esterase C31F10.02 n=1 Tax=Ustilago trichophora TaxID=86804 RepID=A0A5C3EL10_9BASI|nr:related to Putative esterase C31F10.02 [Ustilago trichophora]
MTITQPSACLRFVQRITRGFQSHSGHDSVTISTLRIHNAIPGRIHGTFLIGPHNLNRLGTLHGGCVATLTDTMGSLAIASKGLYSTGVSTDINTTYVKSAGGKGDTVNVMGEVISMGKTLAFTRMEVRHPVTDALLAYGSHTKFIGKAMGHEENVKFDEEGLEVIQGKQPEEWVEESRM